MRQGNGTDLLGVNDPRSASIGVIYVSPNDDRKSVLAAILTQEKLGRKQVAVVLPNQNKAFQRPVDFDDLKTMRRKLQAQIVFIAPSGPGPAEFARQRRFPVYSSLENYAKSLREEAQVEGAAKKGWLFGTPKARPAATPNGNGNNNRVPAGPLAANPPGAPRAAQPPPYRNDEEDNHAGGSVAPFAAGTALGGAAAFGADHFMDAHNNSGNGAGLAYQNDPNTPGTTDPLAPHDFVDDEDDLGPAPTSHVPPATPDNVSGPMQAVPSPGASAGAAGGTAANNIIELPRGGRATLPLSPRQSSPAGVPPVPARPPDPESTTKLPRPQRNSGKMPVAGAAGAAAGGALLGAASAAPPTRTSGAVAGPATGPVVPRTGGGANLPPRTPPPGGGGRGGRGPANRRRNLLLLLFAALLVIALLACGIVAFAAPGSGVGQVVHNALTKTQPPATVTITPASKTVQDNYTIVGGPTTNATQRQVSVRTINGSSQSPSKLVNATGHNAHPATVAHGNLTFFNNAAVAQQVSAGTVFNVGGGVQIITDAAANIPPGNGFTNGSKTVPAHASPAGRAGDIGRLTLNVTSCCATGISVSNTAAFTDGKDAVDYTFLQQSDVNSAITQTVKDTTRQDAVADLNKQLRTGEQQTGSTRCVPTTNADQPIGDKGTNVTSANVTYLVKCTATVYDYAGAQNIVQGLLKEKATTDPTLKGYQLAGAIQTSIAGQTNTRNVFSLFFNAKGIWVYQFTNAQKLQLARAIAGKSVAQAQSILNETTGVASAKIDDNGGTTLPTDPNQISIVIQPVAGLGGQGAPTATSGSPIVTSPTVQSGNPPGTGGK